MHDKDKYDSEDKYYHTGSYYIQEQLQQCSFQCRGRHL